MLTNTEMFWNKQFTKHWLENNTTFKYPETVLPTADFNSLLSSFKFITMGSWVLKPNTGRKSDGVALFNKTSEGFLLYPNDSILDLETFKSSLRKVVFARIQTPKKLRAHNSWFIEKWVHPHNKLHVFTDDKRCPPIIRIIGKPEIHFVAISPMHESSTGLSAAGWQDRKYIWLDLEGNVRPVADLKLDGVDRASIGFTKTRSLINPPVGLKIDGLVEVISQINKEIVPKIKLYKNLNWSCDGTFNSDNEFIVIEMNHAPGLQFKGFSWKR